MKPSRSEFHAIRGLRHHVRIWGDPAAPRLFLLHGRMDVSASFQFLVDGFARDAASLLMLGAILRLTKRLRRQALRP